jgi:hypothetical protein
MIRWQEDQLFMLQSYDYSQESVTAMIAIFYISLIPSFVVDFPFYPELARYTQSKPMLFDALGEIHQNALSLPSRFARHSRSSGYHKLQHLN